MIGFGTTRRSIENQKLKTRLTGCKHIIKTGFSQRPNSDSQPQSTLLTQWFRAVFALEETQSRHGPETGFGQPRAVVHRRSRHGLDAASTPTQTPSQHGLENDFAQTSMTEKLVRHCSGLTLQGFASKYTSSALSVNMELPWSVEMFRAALWSHKSTACSRSSRRPLSLHSP